MPRYYFDVDDGGERFEDASGIDLPDQDAVRREAFTLLRDAVHRLMPEGRHVLTVQVRDEAGRLVYQGEMSVDGRRSLP